MARPLGKRSADCWVGPFADFVSEFSVPALSRELDCHENSVYRWVRGTFQPTPPNAVKIIDVARRENIPLTLEDIYCRNRKT
jgi:hypothetical protein